MPDEVVTEDKVADLAEDIGTEGTLASIQSRVPKMRFDSVSETIVEDAAKSEEKSEEGDDKKAEAQGDDKPEGEEKAEKKPPKYKSIEEAEEAAKNAATKMHEATTTAAQEKAAREALARENAELKQKLEEGLAKAPEEKPSEEAKPMGVEERKAKVRAATKAALTTIRELDRTADDYDDKVEEAWAEALLEAGMTGSPLTQVEIDKMVKESMKAAAEAQKAADAEKAKATAAQTAWQAALEQGKKAGLNLDDEDSADYMLFDAIERRMGEKGLPEELKGKPLTEVVDYIIKEVRRRTGQVVKTTEEERARARKTQTDNSVLTKGMKPTETKPEETQNYTLAELQRADRERRMARQRGA